MKTLLNLGWLVRSTSQRAVVVAVVVAAAVGLALALESHMSTPSHAPSARAHARVTRAHRGRAPKAPARGHTAPSTAPPRTRTRVVPRALIAPTDPFGMYTAVFALSAFGLWAETKPWGAAAGGAPLASSVAALVAANVGLIPIASPVYDAINGVLLPLAVPMLLYTADVKRVIKGSAALLPAFVVGALGTTLGTLVAYFAVPMRALGDEGWKIASALMARHIGGAVNFVAVANALEIQSTMMSAALCADNLMNALYFAGLFALAKGVMPTKATLAAIGNDSNNDAEGGVAVEGEGLAPFSVRKASYALTLACAVGFAAKSATRAFGWTGMEIPIITLVTVALATAVPKKLAAIAGSGESMATLVMQAFFVSVGASGSIREMVTTAPSLFFFSSIQVAFHVVFLLAIAKVCRFDKALALLASNACVGGPTTAAAMASTKSWKSLIVPALLVGVLGYTVATFIGIGFGLTVLSKLSYT